MLERRPILKGQLGPSGSTSLTAHRFRRPSGARGSQVRCEEGSCEGILGCRCLDAVSGSLLTNDSQAFFGISWSRSFERSISSTTTG